MHLTGVLNYASMIRYYACLCGHLEIAQYLLDNGEGNATRVIFIKPSSAMYAHEHAFLVALGARCQVNTFDGERCRYGALTDAIRSLLKNYNVLTTRTVKRNTYDEFLRK